MTFANSFFAKYVEGRDIVDYGKLLERAGLVMLAVHWRPRPEGEAMPFEPAYRLLDWTDVQALAQVQVAENRLVATLGMEPQIGSTSELSLPELIEQLTRNKAPWQQLRQGDKVAQADTAGSQR